MRNSRLMSAPLAAILSAAAFAGPAAASHVPGPPTWPTNPKPITQYHATVSHLPGPPTWPTNPQPISHYHSTVQATGHGLDWESAGIGAAAGVAVLVTGLAGAAGVRRRRLARPRAMSTP